MLYGQDKAKLYIDVKYRSSYLIRLLYVHICNGKILKQSIDKIADICLRVLGFCTKKATFRDMTKLG